MLFKRSKNLRNEESSNLLISVNSRVDNYGRIYIPTDVRNVVNLDPGKAVKLECYKDKVVITID